MGPRASKALQALRKLPLASIDRAKVASKPRSMKLAPKAPRAQLSGAAPANISSSHPSWRQPGGTAKPQSRHRPLAPTGAPDPRPQVPGAAGICHLPTHSGTSSSEEGPFKVCIEAPALSPSQPPVHLQTSHTHLPTDLCPSSHLQPLPCRRTFSPHCSFSPGEGSRTGMCGLW